MRLTDAAFEGAVERYGDTVFRLAYSYLKNRADAEDVMQETLLKLYLEAGEPVFDTPQQSELYQHVMGLPPKYRAAVYLYYYEDCSVQEIAAAMGANPSTVQTWLMRARGKLKLILQEAES